MKVSANPPNEMGCSSIRSTWSVTEMTLICGWVYLSNVDWAYGQRQERVPPRIPGSASTLVANLAFQTSPDWDHRVPEQRLIQFVLHPKKRRSQTSAIFCIISAFAGKCKRPIAPSSSFDEVIFCKSSRTSALSLSRSADGLRRWCLISSVLTLSYCMNDS
jgi:hypothetical protein